MPRTAQARIFRSTQTGGNVGAASTVRDLQTAFGTTASGLTVAQYNTGGTIHTVQWNPQATNATAAGGGNGSVPSADTASTGRGWRDAVAENANEQVRYANAGTFTVRLRLFKSGQTIAVDIVVRLTVIVYEVTSAGAFVSEVGRVVMPDMTLTGAGVASNVSGSFTLPAAKTIGAGNKLQAELYVTTIAAGTPAAPAAFVNIIFQVDDTSASGVASMFTAQPTYDILYGRTFTEAISTTESLARQVSYRRSATESIPTTETLGRVKGAVRSMSEAIPTTETLARAMAYRRTNTEAIPTTETLTRRTTYSRSFAEAIPTTDALARLAAYRRTFTESIPTTEALTRIKGANRSLTESLPLTETLARRMSYGRTFTEAMPTTESLTRRVGYARTPAENIPTTDALVRQLALTRVLAEAIPTTDALARRLALARAFADTIPTTDALVRSMGYSRGLTEDLAVGGGGEAPVTPADIAAIANAVWDELTSEGRATDSYGALVAARLDAAVSSRSSAAAVTALGAPAQASALTTLQGLVDDLEARLTAARAALLDNLPRLDVPVSSVSGGGGSTSAHVDIS